MADRRSNTTGEFRMHVIDVGQGDSLLLEGPDGDTMLIDSGPWQDDGETVLNYLDEHDIDHLDHLVASHYDADHIGGHADVIEEFGSDNIGVVHVPKMGKYGNDSKTMDEFEDPWRNMKFRGMNFKKGQTSTSAALTSMYSIHPQTIPVTEVG